MDFILKGDFFEIEVCLRSDGRSRQSTYIKNSNSRGICITHEHNFTNSLDRKKDQEKKFTKKYFVLVNSNIQNVFLRT